MRLHAVDTTASFCTMKFLLAVLLSVTVANAARILGVFPYPSHSHQIVFKALTMELAERGHELIVFTTYPDKVQRANYTEVSLASLVKYKKGLNFFQTAKVGAFNFLKAVYTFSAQVTDETLSHPVMQELLSPNSGQKFDLVLVQALYYDGIYSLAHHFNAPFVGVSSLPTMTIQNYMFGNPFEVAYNSDALLGYPSEMNLWERIINLYYVLRSIYEYEVIVLPLQEMVVRKHFGDKMPPVRELTQRMSILLTSSQPHHSYPHSTVPSIIHIGGCRRLATNKTLPKNLEEIFNKSKHGVIYFSLGSNMQSTELPNEIRTVLIQTFAELPYTVLWKYEADDMTQLMPKNVITRKWFPQREVLAHPKTVLFMYQGGLQSTEEVTNIGLPLIGFPMFSDQVSNVRHMEKHGLAKGLELTNLNKDELKSTILELITNPRYKENAMKLRNLLRDRPYHPMDNAVWWIEHVIRHKGAEHIRNRSRDMPMYQTLLLDIIAIAALSLVVIVYCSFLVVRFFIRSRKHFKRILDSTNMLSTKKEQ